MAQCIFCGIAAGEVPGNEVGSTDLALAFRDVAPVAPTHVLVIPREHIANAADLSDDHGQLLAEMFGLATEVAMAEGIADSGYRLVFNVGDDAGNTVPHLHLHVIGGRSMSWPPG